MSHPADSFPSSLSALPGATNGSPASGQQDRPHLSEVVEAPAYLETVRHRPALLSMAEDQEPDHKAREDNDVVLLYEALRALGPLSHVYRVGNTTGGTVTTVRKLSQMLHAMAPHLSIL